MCELPFRLPIGSDGTPWLLNARVNRAGHRSLRLARGRCNTAEGFLGEKQYAIAANDLMIASIALSRRLTPVTCNESEFRRVPGLRVEVW